MFWLFSDILIHQSFLQSNGDHGSDSQDGSSDSNDSDVSDSESARRKPAQNLQKLKDSQKETERPRYRSILAELLGWN